MSDAIAGMGTKFEISDMGTTPVWTAVAEITDINGPNRSRDQIEVTNLDSTGGYKEFIAGFRDGGEVVLSMNYTHDGYNAIEDEFASNDVAHDYRIVLPESQGNTLTMAFKGQCIKIGMKVPTGDKISADTTFKISGAVTLTSTPVP